MALYDSIGLTYRSTRRADPRIGAAIEDALGNAASVVNVGAGAGSYEPDRTIAAIEPSEVMIAQRPAGSAPWTDLAAGIAELRRIARRRLVIFTWRPEAFDSFWLLAGYLPEAGRIDHDMGIPIAELTGLMRNAEIHPRSGGACGDLHAGQGRPGATGARVAPA